MSPSLFATFAETAVNGHAAIVLTGMFTSGAFLHSILGRGYMRSLLNQEPVVFFSGAAAALAIAYVSPAGSCADVAIPRSHVPPSCPAQDADRSAAGAPLARPRDVAVRWLRVHTQGKTAERARASLWGSLGCRRTALCHATRPPVHYSTCSWSLSR
jgi:hypothetical protein